MAGVVIKKKEGESASSLIFRFTKKVQQSGVLREAKGRRFSARKENKMKRRLSALHRLNKKNELEKAKKTGLV